MIAALRVIWFVAYCIILLAVTFGLNYWAALYGAPQSLWMMQMLGWM